MKRQMVVRGMLGVVALGALLVVGACGKGRTSADAPKAPEHAAAPGTGAVPATGQMEFCDFKAGADTAAVKVVAFYPGRHEDTLAAVKGLLEKFPEQVSVEIVDWRRKEGMERRDQAGLTCAGITVNGKNAFDLTVDGKTEKVMFIRGINGDWTEPQLLAAVKAEVEAVKAKP